MVEEENKKQPVDIFPLGKGKRMLAFLADFFLNFILTFVLFNAAAMPSIRPIATPKQMATAPILKEFCIAFGSTDEIGAPL